MSNSKSPEYGLQSDGTFSAPAGRINFGWDLHDGKHNQDTVYLYILHTEVPVFLRAIRQGLSNLPEYTDTVNEIATFLVRNRRRAKIDPNKPNKEEITVALKPVLAQRSLFEENLLLFRDPDVAVTVVQELLRQAQRPRRRKTHWQQDIR